MAENIFVKRPKLAMIISLVIILAGLIVMGTLPVEEYPSITPPQVVVSATYSGASAEVIASTVAAPIELQLNGVENMIYMSSDSKSGSYKLTLYFAVGSDPDMALVNVQNQLQLVTPRLPEEVKNYGLTVKKSTGGPGVLVISIKSPHRTYSALFLANYATRFLKDEIARIKGVGEVNIFGAGEYAMRIWLKPDRMASLGISTSDIAAAIQGQNIQSPAGTLGGEPMETPQVVKFTLKTKGRLKTPEEFENIVIKSNSDGANVKIKDVARVELGGNTYTSVSRVSGNKIAVISVSQLPEANAIDLANKIRAKMEVLSKSFPPDMVWAVQYDNTEFVRESIHEVISAIILAIILVSIVTYLFLGTARAAFIPFCAIPVSLIGVFIFMGIFGFSINLLILFGMVLAVGLVVDDAIVVLENTQRHIQEGKTPKDATETTMDEVFGAVVATSLVLMAVFVPVSFMSGITGQMFRQFGLCLAVSIGLSTVVALTLSPALCSIILKGGTEKADFEFIQKFDDWFLSVRDKYLNVVKYFVSSPKRTLKVLGFIVIFILFMFIIIPKGFLPDEDKGALLTQIQLPDSATLNRSDEVGQAIAKEIEQLDGVRDTLEIAGFSGDNTVFIISELEPWSKRKSSKLSMASIQKQINGRFRHYPDGTVATFAPSSISGMSMYGGFEYILLDKGDKTPEELYTASQKFLQQAGKSPKFSKLFTTYTASLPQIKVLIDDEKAMALGVDIADVYDTLAAQLGGTYINDFNQFSRVYRVYIQADAPYRIKPSDFEKIYIRNKNGGMVPLTSIVRFENTAGPYIINRYNLYSAVTINGTPANNISSGQAMNEMESLSDKYLDREMGYEWSGTSLQEKQSSGQIGPILVMALIFVYLFLVALYESWTLPVAVMLISPVALVGALFFQYVSGYALDIYSQIGLVMLVGLGTKQAILIVEFAKDAMEKDGLNYIDAAMQAAKLRFRAVMMTNIAFILGLLPLVMAKGAGAGSRHSIGMTVFGGMIAVSFIGSILVPAFFVMINIMKEWAYSGGFKKVFGKMFIFAKGKSSTMIEELKKRRK
ncbi:MAG: efflux RND transporter permease subunit [Candidatus Gastranaerophilales bacterium]|nr:efflux RND transporter permease subunit [Candidatus Gastranaerophilales bacterium]